MAKCISSIAVACIIFMNASLLAKISMQPLSIESYPAFYQTVLQSGMHDLIDSGYDQITAQEGICSELDDLLPQGIKTPGHYILGIFDNDAVHIGSVWYAIENEKAWLYFLGIDPAYQGKGYASQALAVLESHLIQQKISSLALNVFASNSRAFSLYKKCGFKILESFCLPNGDKIWRYEMKKYF